MTIRSYQYTVQALVTASSLSFTVNHDLALVSVATDGVRRDVEQELNLVTDATWLLQPFNGDSVVTELNLTQEAKAFGFEGVESTLNLTSEATRQILNTKVVPQALNLVSDAQYRYGVRNLAVESVLSLTGIVNRIWEMNVTSFLTLGNSGERVFTPTSELNLTSTAEFGFGFSAESDLDLTSLVELNKVLGQNIVDDNVVTQSCTYFIEKPCNRYTYNRFHGEGGTVPDAKRLNYVNTFYLQSIDDGTIIELRNPEMDDRQRYAFNRVNRNFFDGSPDVYSGDGWATEQSQVYTIVANKREKLEPLYAFLQDNIGREIIIKDWKGVTWVVIVTNPGDLYAEDSEDYWTLNFDVQGEAFDGEWFIDRLSLAQEASRAGSIYNRSASHGSVVDQNVGRAFDVDGDPTTLSATNIISQEVSYTIE